jgi:hypothetical protein
MALSHSDIISFKNTRIAGKFAIIFAILGITQLGGCGTRDYAGPPPPPPPPPPPGPGTVTPNYIHRGAVTLFTLGGDTQTAAANLQVSVATQPGTPGSCPGNSEAQLVTNSLASFYDPDSNSTISEQVDCSQTYYVTNVKEFLPGLYNVTYFAFKTIPTTTMPTNPPSPAHGHAIYFPASGTSPAGLIFEPE